MGSVLVHTARATTSVYAGALEILTFAHKCKF